MAVIEKRYAEALLAVAKDPSEADRFAEGLQDMCTVFQEDPGSYHFLTAPHIPHAVKKETVEKIFPQDEWRMLSNFILLLIDKNRIKLLPELYREYCLLKYERQNHLEIKVSSAMPLEESQLEKIMEKFRKQYGASDASVIQIIDPALLGGVLIQIGDIRIDDTQRGRVNALRRFIEESTVSETESDEFNEYDGFY